MHDRPEDQNVDEDLAIDEAEELKEVISIFYYNFINYFQKVKQARLDVLRPTLGLASGGLALKSFPLQDPV